MIRAAELALPAKPVPYYRARIAELVAQGKAVIREPGRTLTPAATRMHRTAARLSWTFAARLAEMQDVRVYYVPCAYKLSFRRQNPRPALNGKIYVQPLPAAAEFVGRYSYPHSRRGFMRDLLEVMGGKAE